MPLAFEQVDLQLESILGLLTRSPQAGINRLRFAGTGGHVATAVRFPDGRNLQSFAVDIVVSANANDAGNLASARMDCFGIIQLDR